MSDALSDSRLQHLSWLADAPLFIDEAQVKSFYDAVVRPPGRTAEIRYKVDQKHATELAGKLNLSGEITPGAIVEALAGLVPSLKASAELEGQVSQTSETSKGSEILIESIETPQRQLVLLTVHFMLKYYGRWFFVDNLAKDAAWRDPATILKTPKSLVFLDFPGLVHLQPSMVPTQMVPMALELEGVGVKTIHDQIKNQHGNGAPKHPGDASDDETRRKRQEYWKWFSENFDPRALMELLETIVAKGKIRWIDFRVPLNSDGDTVHLHVAPQGKYDAGTFAYNLIKRGYKHGIRIVGTVKSEPDVNVLAIYEK